jgi:hypothetical protein
MGTWGVGIYSDDVACDVRDTYKEILGDGIGEPDATKRMIEEWKDQLSDPDDAPVFWLALADTQWKQGRLQERVKLEANKVIQNGTDLDRWGPNQKIFLKRKQVLERLKAKLETTQPPEKKVRKRFVNATDWELGDVYSLRLSSSVCVLLHVIGFHQDKGGRGPVCEILDWVGENTPSKNEITAMDFKYAEKPNQHLSQFLFGSLSKSDYPKHRVKLEYKGIKPKQKLGGYGIIPWRYVDRQFNDLFSLR